MNNVYQRSNSPSWKGFDFVDLAVRVQHRSDVPGMTKQYLAPVVDQLGYVHGPIDLGDLTEHRCQDVVENDLAVEAHDEVVHIGSRSDVVRELVRHSVHSVHSVSPASRLE